MSEPAAPDLVQIGEDVDWPDHDAGTAVRDRLASRRDLGTLADLAEWAVAACPAARGKGFARVRAIAVGTAPGPAAAALADCLDATTQQLPDPPEDVPGAFAAGVAAADLAADSGADLLVAAFRPTGIAPTTAVAVLTDTEPVKVLSRGAAATDPEAWMSTAVRVRDLRRRCQPVRSAPGELLQLLGDAPLAATAGLVLRAAARRTPVVLDGAGALAAALLAYEVQPRAVRWWVSADAGSQPAAAIAHERLGLRAVLSLGSDVGDTTAGLLAVLALQAALRLAGPEPGSAENGYR